MTFVGGYIVAKSSLAVNSVQVRSASSEVFVLCCICQKTAAGTAVAIDNLHALTTTFADHHELARMRSLVMSAQSGCATQHSKAV